MLQLLETMLEITSGAVDDKNIIESYAAMKDFFSG